MPKENKDQNQEKEIEELRRFIATAEESLESAKKALSKLTGEDISKIKSGFKPSNEQISALNVVEGGKVIEGIFDGENMVGPENKVYPVPANYASKSKLVEGDKLKLTVAEDGSFIFKQIGPAQRQKIIGTLSFDDNMYHVLAEGKTYNILYASVTYFKAKPGDRVTIVIPAEGDAHWAALENIIHDVPGSSPEEEKNMTGEPQNSNPLNGLPDFPNIDNVQDATSGQASLPSDEPAKSDTFPTESTNFNGAPIASDALPEESFLPRDHGDEENALGETLPQDKPKADEDKNANELEI